MNALSDEPSSGTLAKGMMSTGQRSVRTYLVLLVLACLLPGIVGAGALFVHEYRQGRAQLERGALQMARALMQAVDNHILQAQTLAQGLATSDALSEGDLARFHEQARRALDESRLAVSMVLADEALRQLVNTLKEFGEPLPSQGNPDTIRRVFETGRPVVSDLYIGTVSRRPLVSVAVPVVRGGRVVYALNIGIIPDQLNEILSAQRLPSGWVATVFDGDGTIAARSRAWAQFEGQKPSEQFVHEMANAEEGTFAATMRDGVPVRAAHTRSPLTGWRVVVAIPQDTLDAQLREDLGKMMAGVAALFIVGLALAWLVGGRIARAFRSLMEPAAALGAGEPVALPPVEVKEATELGRAMEKASRLLRERTAALVATNTELMEKDRELAEAHTLARFGTWYWDVRAGELTASGSVRDICGGDLPPFQDLKGTLLPAEEWERLREALQQLPRTGGFDLELEANHASGARIWVNVKGEAIRRLEGSIVAVRGTLQDITERRLAEQRVREAALHDPLTGLPNRRLVFEYGGHLLAAARRSHGRGALLFIDLDRFKPINDLHGHEAGDRVLQEVARRLVQCTREEDLVGRLGGDEFVIMLPYLDAGRHRAAAVAQHVIDSICRPIMIGGLELSLSPSIGIAYYPEHATDVSALIHAADMAMYRAKQSGRGNFQFYTPELDRKADALYVLEERLRRALEKDRFELHYQPVVDVERGTLIGAEALVRLADEDGEAVGPSVFIPVAESAGLIGGLGEWVAAEACRQHLRWRDEGLEVPIAINVSPLQFRQRDFAERLRDIIAGSGVSPECLQVEVTESTVMEDIDEAVGVLRRVKALGVRIALDDFGTGYSSLSRLSSLPLDTLKVDQSFVRGIDHDQASRAVTEAVIALARSLDLEVIGEGIESEGALDYLRKRGCHQAQGFWFSRPLPAPDFLQWYRQRYAH